VLASAQAKGGNATGLPSLCDSELDELDDERVGRRYGVWRLRSGPPCLLLQDAGSMSASVRRTASVMRSQ